jgi:Methyltransferase domain
MLNTGIMVKVRSIIDGFRYGEINYVPRKFVMPPKLVESQSQAWVGLEQIIQDVIEFSGIETKAALEFGVEFGYSTSALSNYFKAVTGVDIFTGDSHAGHFGDIYEQTSQALRDFKNITLVKADYKDFIEDHNALYDLIHVDIIHTYEDTYRCGLWSAKHSRCTIFHDTQSFPDVKRAVADIAKKTGKRFYNYKKCNGLGIII